MNFIAYFTEHYRGRIPGYSLSLAKHIDGDILTISCYGLFRAQIDNNKELCEVTIAPGYKELLDVFKEAKKNYKESYPELKKKIEIKE